MLKVSDGIEQFLNARLRRRFAAKLMQNGECLEFTGLINENGYGIVTARGARILAHRLAWVIANEREVPTGKIVCHRCNNTKCCNPKHLYAGTHQDNADDRRAADLAGPVRRSLLGVKGTNHPRSFSADKRRRAILMRAESKIGFKEIAAEIGCRRQTVERWWAEHEKAVAVAANARTALKH